MIATAKDEAVVVIRVNSFAPYVETIAVEENCNQGSYENALNIVYHLLSLISQVLLVITLEELLR